MRGEHVADLGPRGRKESCRTRSLASRACLRLVGPHGRTSAAASASSGSLERLAGTSRSCSWASVPPSATAGRHACAEQRIREKSSRLYLLHLNSRLVTATTAL